MVLNQDYSPLTVCSAERAFLLIYADKAERVHDDPELTLRTVSSEFKMPSVIRLQKYIYVPFKSVLLSRQNVFKRDRQKCQYCGSTKDLTLDHVHPRSKNGKSTWNNLVTACKHCNSKKGDGLPEEAGLRLKQQPYRPSYTLFLQEHSGAVYEEWRPYLQTG